MAQNSRIEWTECTWNPVRGCSRCSPGCQHCYAERMAARFSGPGKPYEGLAAFTPSGPRWTNRIGLVRDALDQPLRWRNPRVIFVNSMSDLFHEEVPEAFIGEVFDVMRRADHHVFQVLTKRADRLAALSPQLPWTPNIWMGVSVEAAEYLHRIDRLRKTGAMIKFLSLEPLLGPLFDLDLQGVDWAIVGGESGPGARPMEVEWVRSIRDQCIAATVPLFFKQWGQLSTNPDPGDPTAKPNGGTAKGGRMLDGRTWDEMPGRPPSRSRDHSADSGEVLSLLRLRSCAKWQRIQALALIPRVGSTTVSRNRRAQAATAWPRRVR
ncbi:MAG: phage Gp37/Gp68 family protein [Planctomycetes bacterium]|nr:phage Gp37/Gp68 family protein [Planctomycetota bacterium]